MSDQINFKKKATPQHIAFNQSTLITYTLSNLTTLPITEATIYDPLITIPGLSITAHHNCQLNFTDSTILLGLPEQGLNKNENISCTIQAHSTPTTSPSDSLYATTAHITVLVSSTPPISLTEEAKSNLTINCAHLTVYNSISPTKQVAPGETVVYNIELKNTGNQTAIIRPGEFLNYWSPLRLSNIIVEDNRLLASETQITNSSTLRIPKNTSLSFTVSATII